MREEGLVVVKEEKRCFWGCLFRVVKVVAVVYGVVTAVKKVLERLSRRLEEDNEESDRKRYVVGLDSKEIRLEGEDVSEVDMTVVGSCAELDLTDAELAEETFVKLRALGGKVVVKVPAMVRVDFSGKGVVCGFSNMVPSYENESLPVIHVDAESVGACLKIVLGDA